MKTNQAHDDADAREHASALHEHERQKESDREVLRCDAPRGLYDSLYALIAQVVAGERPPIDPAQLGACALRWAANDLRALWALHEESTMSAEAIGQPIYQAQERAAAAADLIDRVVAANKAVPQ